MDWTEILKKIRRSKKHLAINIVLGDDGNLFHVVETQLNKEQLEIQKTFTAKSLEELAKNVSKNLPVLAVFSGQRIITKKAESTEGYESGILFNSDPDDFYWYELPQQNGLFVSVIRKKDVDDIIGDMAKLGLSLIDIAIGPLVVHSIKPLIGNIPSISVDGYSIKFEKDVLTELGKHNDLDSGDMEVYPVGEEKLPKQYLLSFAAIVNYLYPNLASLKDARFLLEKQQEYKFKKAFNMVGMIALPSFLIVLLTSYLLLGYYQDKYLDLQVKIEEQNVAYNKLIRLQEDKRNKEAMLNESGLSDSNFLTYYVLQLTEQVPAQVTLASLNTFPSEKKIKPKEKIQFQHNLIEIEGSALSNMAFTQWIKALKTLKWIDNLEIMDFTKDGKRNTFKIKLIVRFDV